jgi:predicted nucleic acid-binding protein
VEERRGVIVDTCVLASRKLEALRTFQAKLCVTPAILLEYLNWALEARTRWLAKGDARRARSYERLIELLPLTLSELGIGIVEQRLTIAELGEAASLVLHRGVDPGDALNAITARKAGLGIATLDRDWQRLSDYAAGVIIL